MRAPYRPLRTPSSSAVPTAEKYEPPAPMMLTSANCEAPENKTSDSKHTWIRFRCASTATAPNDNPNGVTLTPMVNARLRIRRSAAVRFRASLGWSSRDGSDIDGASVGNPCPEPACHRTAPATGCGIGYATALITIDEQQR